QGCVFYQVMNKQGCVFYQQAGMRVGGVRAGTALLLRHCYKRLFDLLYPKGIRSVIPQGEAKRSVVYCNSVGLKKDESPN
ncbi:MAG: hypothetical protein ACPGWR_24280, partial [Ardenticatenaceae bacterium]